MSKSNLARTLPPGDRDEVAPIPDGTPRDLFVGGEVAGVQPGGASSQEMLPGLALIIEQIGPALDECQMALGDLKLAQKQCDMALFKAAARRLGSLAHHVARTAKHYKPRETKLQTENKE